MSTKPKTKSTASKQAGNAHCRGFGHIERLAVWADCHAIGRRHFRGRNVRLPIWMHTDNVRQIRHAIRMARPDIEARLAHEAAIVLHHHVVEHKPT